MRALLLGRRRVPAVVAELEPAAHSVRAPGRLLVVARRGSRSPGAARGRARRASRRIAGRTKSMKVTIAETGLPGSPKTSAAAAACDAEPGRLARAQRHAPEDLLDAERGERRADVVVLADRDAAADDREVGRRAPGRAPRGWPRGRRGRSRPRAARRPRARPSAGDASRRWSCGSRPGRSGSSGPLSSSPVVEHRDPRPARAGDLARARPRRARRAPRGRARRPRASTVSPAAMSSPARRMSLPGLDRAPGPRPRSPPPSVSSTRTTASAPAGHHRPGRDRDRLARAERARRRVPGARLADHARAAAGLGAGAGGVGGPHRVAVHRRVVEAGHGVGAR